MLNILRQVSRNCCLAAVDCNYQQFRGLHVFKRKYDVPLTGKGCAPKKLKARHFVYERFEDKVINTKREKLNLILTSNVEGVGVLGDEIQVKPKYGYEQLLLPGLAEYATDETREKVAALKQTSAAIQTTSSPYVSRMINVLKRMSISVVMNKETPWTIEPWHVRVAMRKAGLHVLSDSQITLPETKISGPDLELEGKLFVAKIKINNKEEAPIRCFIHHWSTKLSDRLPYEFEFWLSSKGFMTEDDEEIISSLPPLKPKSDRGKSIPKYKR